MKVESIEEQFSDGITIINFVELLVEKKLKKKFTPKPKQKIHIIENTHLALEFLKENGVQPKYLTAASEDFYDRNIKLILGFLWMLFRKFRIAAQMGVDDVDKTTEGLLKWCKEITEGYKGVDIKDFKHSFSDGNAFLAMVHAFDKDSFNYDSILEENSTKDVIQTAFDLAEKNLGIPQLLDANELMDGTIDERSVILYTSLYFHAFVSAEEKRAIENEKKAASAKALDLENELEILNKKVQNKEEEVADLQMKYEELVKDVEKLKMEKEKLEKEEEEIRNLFKKLGEQIEDESQFQVKHLSNLREHLTLHVSSMHKWKEYLEQQREYESETIQLRTEQEISNREFEDQLEYLSDILSAEHNKLQILLKQREFEEEEEKKRRLARRNSFDESEEESKEEVAEKKEAKKEEKEDVESSASEKAEKNEKKEESDSDSESSSQSVSLSETSESSEELSESSEKEKTPSSEKKSKKEVVESSSEDEKASSPSTEKKKSSKKKESVEDGEKKKSSKKKVSSPSGEKKKSSKKK